MPIRHNEAPESEDAIKLVDIQDWIECNECGMIAGELRYHVESAEGSIVGHIALKQVGELPSRWRCEWQRGRSGGWWIESSGSVPTLLCTLLDKVFGKNQWHLQETDIHLVAERGQAPITLGKAATMVSGY